jgi:hypothetical protein
VIIMYDEIVGRVGQPLRAAPVSTCRGVWQPISQWLDGDLPPGISQPDSEGRFAGMPQRTGSWEVRMSFMQNRCDGQYYPMEEIRVRFVIAR